MATSYHKPTYKPASTESSADQAVHALNRLGAVNAKQQDRHGDTKTGWWLDDVWLARSNDPVAAVQAIKGGQ